MTRRPLNPFQVSRLPSAEEFCDREREVARFRQVWGEPGAKLVAYGDRRLGKSAVLDRAAEEARAAGRMVVVFSVATALGPEDAVQRLIRAVHAAIGRSWKTLVQDLAGALRLSVTMAPAPDGTSVPEFSLGLEPRGAQASAALLTDALDAIEAQLQRRRLHLGLGIDEFQRLLAWGGEDIEWQLKAALEKHRRLSYVLTGSSTSLIEEMVSTKGRALWKAVETLRIGPIPAPELQRWIVERSRRSGLPLTSALAVRITALAGPRTRDVIVLARATWEDARTRDDGGDPDRALLVHLAETGDLHARIWDQRTERERRILRMLASNPTVEPTAENVRHHYRLGASSTVTKAIGVLVRDEVLARDGAAVVFDDPFFRAWVRQSTGGDVRSPGA